MVSKLQTKRCNGWANRDTYLYSLSIDSDEKDHAFRKVVLLCRSEVVDKKQSLMNIFNKLKIKQVLSLDNVDYDEIIKVYSKEYIIDAKRSRSKKICTR